MCFHTEVVFYVDSKCSGVISVKNLFVDLSITVSVSSGGTPELLHHFCLVQNSVRVVLPAFTSSPFAFRN